MSPVSPRLARARAAAVAALLVAGLGALWLVRERRPAGPRPPTPAAPIVAAEIEAELAAREARASAAAAQPVRAEARPAPDVGDAGAETLLTVGARLLDAEARPLGDGRLEWLVADPEGWPVVAREARCDRAGAVWLRIPRAELAFGGPLLLAAGGPGRMRTLVRVEPERFATLSVLTLGELALRAGGTLRGRVRGAAGQGLSGATVALVPELGPLTPEEELEARLWPRFEDLGLGAVPPLARTDGEGRFELVGMPAGRFAVLATWSVPGAAPLLADREQGVVVRPGAATEVRDLVLREARAEELVAGVVLAPDGRALEGARLELEAQGRPQGLAAESSATGRFALLAPAGRRFRLTARDPAGRWCTSLPDVSPGSGDLVLRLAEAEGPAGAGPSGE